MEVFFQTLKFILTGSCWLIYWLWILCFLQGKYLPVKQKWRWFSGGKKENQQHSLSVHLTWAVLPCKQKKRICGKINTKVSDNAEFGVTGVWNETLTVLSSLVRDVCCRLAKCCRSVMLSKSCFEKLEKLWSQEMFRTKSHAVVNRKILEELLGTAWCVTSYR